MTTTTDLSKFGSRERAELIKILTAWQEHGLPNDFDDDEDNEECQEYIENIKEACK